MRLGPFPTGAPWGSAAVQAWLDRLRQIYNNEIDATAIKIQQASPGMDGQEGPEGEMGPPGPPGPAGTGSAGPTGPAGPIGPPGFEGSGGEDGDIGPPGPVGATGATGSTGPTGSVGPIGPPGMDGESDDPWSFPYIQRLNEVLAPVASVEFLQQQALQFRIENRTSDPSSPANGQIWIRTDL